MMQISLRWWQSNRDKVVCDSALVDLNRLRQKITIIFALELQISKVAKWINNSNNEQNVISIGFFSFAAAIGFSKELNNSVLNKGGGLFWFGYDLSVTYGLLIPVEHQVGFALKKLLL